VTSQGQRFRRRALRRGYKVDEVDAFLDRVEATLGGQPLDAPVSAQEVHDVVFRVRFGGYDEWQVDLHLDRVERQLAEAAPHLPAYGRMPEPDRIGPPDRHGPPDRIGPPDRMGFPDRPPPMAGGPGAIPGPVPAPGPAPMPHHLSAPGRPAAAAPAGYPGPEPGYGPYDEPTYGGYDGPPAPRGPERPELSDATSEMRFGDPGGPPIGAVAGRPEPGPGGPGPGGPGGPPGGPAGPRGPAPYPTAPPPMSVPPPGQLTGGYGGGFDPGGYGGAPSGDLQRLDEMRRTFQPRRFGSGYDRGQVDRLFEEVMAGVAGHGPIPVSETELDPRRFDLVPGGYFEREVDAALHELRDILRRR
jgi:DivIVA domain-containing protein